VPIETRLKNDKILIFFFVKKIAKLKHVIFLVFNHCIKSKLAKFC